MGNRSGTPDCECSSGYYEKNEICLKCNFRVATCELHSDGVSEKPLTCKDAGNRQGITACLCNPGKYDIPDGDGLCLECGNKCATCEDSKFNCLTCRGNFRKGPADNCECLPGYHDNGIDEDCSECSSHRCDTCARDA